MDMEHFESRLMYQSYLYESAVERHANRRPLLETVHCLHLSPVVLCHRFRHSSVVVCKCVRRSGRCAIGRILLLLVERRPSVLALAADVEESLKLYVSSRV